MNKIPLVSICSFVFNHEKFLEQTIQGFLLQKCNFQIEILIHDDFSSDKSKEIIEKYSSIYPDLIFPILQTENTYSKYGGQKMVTDVFQKARGKYIALCEGDDYWIDPLKLQKQIDFMESNAYYGFTWTRSNVLNEINSTIRVDPNGKYLEDENDIGFEFGHKNLLSGWYMVMQSLIFKSKLVEEINDIKYKYFRDIHLILHLLKFQNGYCLNFVGSIYRVHNTGEYSGSSLLNRALVGYESYKELFLVDNGNEVIRHKYKSFTNQYISECVKNKFYWVGFLKTIEVLKISRNPKYFFYYFLILLKSLKP